MQKLGLKKKIMILVLSISIVSPIVAGIIIYRNTETSEQYKIIAENNLPRANLMGSVLSSFRQLRVDVRSLAIIGNSSEDFEKYLKQIGESRNKFLEYKEQLSALMTSPEEMKFMTGVEDAWKKFEALGNDILALHKKGDPESLNQMAVLIREKCPVIAHELDTVVEDMISWQEKQAKDRSQMAMSSSEVTTNVSLIIALCGVALALTGGGYFASSIVNTISRTMRELEASAKAIHKESDDVAGISSNLSEAATQQAASLQETVASIDEISAMVARNSDSAIASVRTSEDSTRAAEKGKQKVEEMKESIQAIAAGNKFIMDEMQRTNQEISDIVNVITEIGQKTQVINDIVFQTKLLSFNASVEAARAGEHGKGFSVVAEEVGNLASMSGKAANEISEMLNKSVNRVTEIVNGTKSLMDNLVIQSKEKVDMGTTRAEECADALDEIMKNVSSVNELLKEISTASREQSTGILEVNKAMSELDHVTQQNTNSSRESSQAAIDLNNQVELLNKIVADLSGFVEGGTKEKTPEAPVKKAQVIHLPNKEQKKMQEPLKKAAGFSDSVPASSDPRFEDV